MATQTDAASMADSLLTGENAAWVDDTYRRWLRDPSSVDPKWGPVFQAWAAEELPGVAAAPAGPTAAPRSIFAAELAPASATLVADAASIRRQSGVVQLINAFRVRGHTEAKIDPLGQQRLESHPELQLSFYGLTDADLDEVVHTASLFGAGETATLRTVRDRCRRAYCSGFGVEFMNIGEIDKKRWLQERIETLQDRPALTKAQLLRMLRLMSDAENFERMLHGRFPGTKRFSVEGAETLVPLLDLLLGETGARGVEEVLIGMAHRGRLNVLANILEKPVRQIVEEFAGTAHRPSLTASGDVKYHLGFSALYKTAEGRELLLSLAFNPSHLEAVDPVVEGRARARRERRGDAGNAVMPVLIHGDAAFAGQGVVAEVLNLSELHGYRTGGTIHIIVNNQIGFTTSPADARSTPYCTDVARMLSVPIFHVNGEDVEAVASVVKLAAEWRQTFHQDVIIDMYCYRKHGHNEGDEPSFTQPLLYDAIRRKESPCVIYARAMVEQMGAITQAEADAVAADSLTRLEACLNEPLGPAMPPSPRFEVTRLWERYLAGDVRAPVDTRFDLERLRALLLSANTIPDGFSAHAKIKRLMVARLAMVRGEAPVDWAVAEQAAYASLLAEGFSVRLSGQDSGRGTFSHRHAVLTDIKTGDEHAPLSHLAPDQARFSVYDSLLSEAAVLGFEYGYSLEAPDGLVLWEAQFGDFANGAQVIIDNFIVSGEQKWQRCSGVVMLLPHGFEGQGPEHSSARLERYLQSCAEDNIIVANCTTPASFFHLLRRQVKWSLRKPLVVMSPKSLLRHPRCTSTLEELAQGSFEPVLADPSVSDPSAVRRVVMCSGKVYYDLLAARGDEAGSVALLRVEQLYPFPTEQLRAALSAFAPDVELVWCQEEPRNMGAWPMYDEWMRVELGLLPRFAGREAAASPATGYPEKHKAQHERLLLDALSFT